MKVIYYMPVFLKKQAFETDNKPLINFCEIFKIISPNACIIDRTDSFDTPFDIEVLSKIPSNDGTIYSYDDLCINRAIDLLKTNENITIFYSGGIDSTVVLLSFYQAIMDGVGSFDQITIAATPHSIIENPKLWYELVLPNFKLVSVKESLSRIDKNIRYVMGENADQLFGSDILLTNFDLFDQELNSDNINKFLIKRGVTPGAMDYMQSIFDKFSNNPYVRLSKMSDLIWWLNYSSKWQSVSLRTLCFTNFLDVITDIKELDIFETFFNTEKFQKCSLYSNLPKWGNIPSSYNYKQASRDFIHKYYDLGDYITTKIKVPSLYRVLAVTDYKYNALGLEDGKIFKLDKIQCR